MSDDYQISVVVKLLQILVQGHPIIFCCEVAVVPVFTITKLAASSVIQKHARCDRQIVIHLKLVQGVANAFSILLLLVKLEECLVFAL